jgi:uncharacterized protein involved in type VI secretion and phage assembly
MTLSYDWMRDDLDLDDDKSSSSGSSSADKRYYGVVVGKVINPIDPLMLGRVQVQLPFIDSVDLSPWARVAVAMAGKGYGSFFIPIPGDEVLVAFEHGDTNVPYIIGSLWNTMAPPPVSGPGMGVIKRVIHTPLGHEIEFDDAAQSITITSATKQKVKLGPDGIEITSSPGNATIKLDTGGGISIQGQSIDIKGTSIKLTASNIDINGSGSTNVSAGGACNIKGGHVNIN